jgi:hypothetical protein
MILLLAYLPEQQRGVEIGDEQAHGFTVTDIRAASVGAPTLIAPLVR